jgi:hypothetical protein
MEMFFAVGSTRFLIAPFSGYAQLAGDVADSVTFFVGSVLFTAGGALLAQRFPSASPLTPDEPVVGRCASPPTSCS